MLIHHELEDDPILSILSNIRGVKETVELEKGIYQIGHFGSSHWPEGFEQYPETSLDPYGVCDDYHQVLEQCPELQSDPNRKFIVTVTPIVKSELGWRWHKWGGYIGNQKITQEYLYDEPVIEKVYCYHIYEEL